jgi:hypothetical protein
MALDLRPDRALVFRITHINNVPWILDHGLHCASSDVLDPNFRPIGDRELIEKRAGRPIPAHPFGTISDYVAFYFTPCSVMLYNIKTGFRGIEQVPMKDIAVLVSSLPALEEHGVPYLFTKCHAYLAEAQFFSSLVNLAEVDWAILRDRDFRNTPDDQGKKQRYQAEALAYGRVPVVALHGIAVYGDTECARIRKQVVERGLDIKVITRPGWFFA